MGNVNDEGTITGWTEIVLDHDDNLYRDDSFFVVQIQEDTDGFDHFLEGVFRAYQWKDPNLSLFKLIQAGTIDTTNVANEILGRSAATRLH